MPIDRNQWIVKVWDYHAYWISVAKKYGQNEDAVQDMYAKLLKLQAKDRAIVNGEVKKGFVYSVLKNICIDICRKECKTVPQNKTVVSSKEIDHEEFHLKVREVLKEKHWYYEQIFLYYTDAENPSIRKLAEETGISPKTIRLDIVKVKEAIRPLEKEYYQYKASI